MTWISGTLCEEDCGRLEKQFPRASTAAEQESKF
jgi:hypothetical protein